jgi:DUF1009 family protein
MIESGATALVIDANRTLVFDRDELIDTANKHSIAIIGLEQNDE